MRKRREKFGETVETLTFATRTKKGVARRKREKRKRGRKTARKSENNKLECKMWERGKR